MKRRITRIKKRRSHRRGWAEMSPPLKVVTVPLAASAVVDRLLDKLRSVRRRAKASSLSQESSRQRADLQRERDFSRLLLDTVASLVVVLDTRGRVVHFNRHCEEVSGYQAEEVLGRFIWELLPPEEVAGVQEAFAHLLGGTPVVYETHWLTKGGEKRLIAWSSRVLIDEQGRPELVVGTGLDVTESRRAQETLRESERRYFELYLESDRQRRELALLDRVRMAIGRELEPQGLIRRLVEAVADAFGYAQVSVYTLEDGGLVLQHQVGYDHVLDRIPVTQGVMGRVVRSGEAVLLKDVTRDEAFLGAIQNIVSEICVPLKGRSGLMGVLNIESVRGMTLNEDDLRLMKALGDKVSVALERAHLYTELRESEARLQDFLDNANDLVQSTSPDGTLLYTNRTWRSSLGYSAEEAASMSIFDIMHPDCTERCMAAFSRVLAGEAVSNIAATFVAKDGCSVEVIGSVNCRFEEGVPAATRGIFRDVTEMTRAEAALRESEARFRHLAGVTFEGIAISQDGLLLDANERFLEMFGYRADEVVGTSVLRFAAPEDHSEILRRMKTGDETAYEVTALRRDSSSFPAELVGRATVYRGQSARVTAIRDITTRKEAERELLEQRNFAQQVMETMGQGLTVTDREGRFLYVNRAYTDMLGFEPDALRGKTPFEVTVAEDRAALREAGEQRRRGEVSHYETRLRCADGSEVYALLTGAPRYRDGEVVGSIVVATDLSERRRTEEALNTYREELEAKNRTLETQHEHLLRLSEFRSGLMRFTSETLSRGLDESFYGRLLARAVEVIPGAEAGSILLKDEGGRYRFVATHSFELSALQGVSFSASELLVRADLPEPRRVHDLHRQLERLPTDGQEVLRNAGRVDHIQASLAVPVLLGNELVAVLHLNSFSERDAFGNEATGFAEAFAVQVGALLKRLTLEAALRERNAEIAAANVELERANRLKSEFLANMSHELRTPLTAIIGFSELLQEKFFGPLNEKQQQYVKDIFDSGNHLLALINDVLDLSKVEAGRMELRLEPLEVSETVGSAVSVVKERARKAGLTLHASLPEGEFLSADARKLRQVLYNLLTNAVKFTPRGEVRIWTEGTPDEIRFHVRDTGIGVAPEDQAKLFKEFSQVDASLSRRHSGTGLGLALSKRLVELHGGRIWVESTPGEGSTFSFAIPRQLPTPTETPIHDAAPAPHAHALVVEDDERSAKLLTDLLESEGFEVRRARNGLEALELARRSPPEVITLDLMMPVMSGWDFLETVAEDPLLATIPVIIVSVTGSEHVHILGASAVLSKPIDKDLLINAVVRASTPFLTSSQVLLVDDDPQLSHALTRDLQDAGYGVTCAPNGTKAVAHAKKTLPDLVILDLVLSDMDGFDLADRLQEAGFEGPVVLLTDGPMTQELRSRLGDRGDDRITLLPSEGFDPRALQRELQRLSSGWM